MSEPVRVFISHHHSTEENAFTARLVDDLRGAGADVWVDTTGVPSGSFVARISEGLAGRQWMVLVMTPEALASPWVSAEVEAGLNEYHAKRMLGVIPLVMRPCRDEDIPVLWRTLQRYDATASYEAGRGQLFAALGLALENEGIIQTPELASPSEPTLGVPLSTVPDVPLRARLKDLGYQLEILNGAQVIRPPLCAVPAGPFLMGSDRNQDKYAQPNEAPAHWVTLAAFQIAKYPVTVAEYACFLQATGAPTPQGEDGQPWQMSWRTQVLERLEHPVVAITWLDAIAYAAWLAEFTGQPWRLLTEAEWEKAARWDASAGNARLYPWGDTFDVTLCNTNESGKRTTTPVGVYVSGRSACGALDMAGNVWEWTTSMYAPYLPVPSGDFQEAGSTESRVIRGGSWLYDARFARTAYRYLYVLNYTGPDLGFRLAYGAPII